MEPRLLDIVGAAAYLAMTPSALRKRVRTLQIPAVRLGRRVLFDRVQLDEFIERLHKGGIE